MSVGMALEAATPDTLRRPGRGWRFIGLAALGDNRLRKYVLTLLAVIAAPSICLAASLTAVFVAAGASAMSQANLTAVLFIVAVACLAVGGFVLILCVAYLHRRPWRSLVSADLTLDWRRLAIGAGVEGGLLLGVLVVGELVTGAPLRIGTTVSLPLLVPLLLLIPLQAASEEMLFRGYLTQGLGRLIRSRLAIALIVGVLFGALHFNAYGALTIPYLLMISLVFSLVSLRDERLELTIGAHTAMNWVAIGAAGALDASKAEMQIPLVAMAVLLVRGGVFYALTRILVRRFCEPASAV